MALRPVGTIIEQVGLSPGETVSGRVLYRWRVVAHVRVVGAAGRERLAEEIRLVDVPANRLDQIAGQLQDARANLRALLKLVEQELVAKL